MSKLHARGVRDPGLAAAPVDLGDLALLGASVETLGAIRISSGRAGTGTATIESLRDDSVVELELEGGVRLWTSYGRLAERGQHGQLRGAVASSGDSLDLGAVFAPVATRGEPQAAGIESVRAFNLDLGQLVERGKALAKELGEDFDPAAMASELAGEASGPWLAWVFDRLRMKRPGLCRWSPKEAWRPVHGGIQDREPCLVFLHGTASSTVGSFAGLTEAEDGRPWRRLADRFSGRVYALEHRTLGVSPLQNAIDLLEVLPAEARLHLVSHSRGGLIGELLAYGQRDRRPGEKLLEDAFLERLRQRLEAQAGRLSRISQKLAYVAGAHAHSEMDRISRLVELLEERRPLIERFVRVGCPAAGTTLASGRLDEWLSLIVNVLDMTGLGALPTYQLAKGFLLATIKTRTDPSAVPGLAAMVPGAAVATLVNRPDVTTLADLTVVAGDVKPSGVLRRLLVLVADGFYGRDHDFVVDTASMYGGLPRSRPPLACFETGTDVTHFSYFTRPVSVERVLAGLGRADGEVPRGFAPLEPPPELNDLLKEARGKRGTRTPAPDRPVVYLLPGLLGTHLEHDQKLRRDRIWLDPFDLAKGGLDLLDPPSKQRILPEAPISLFYGRLAVHLDESHEVVPFPYDWRLSLKREAGRLADDLKARLKDRRGPIRLIAHSMGGILLQAALAQAPDLWALLSARPGSRVLFVGTPFLGSFAVVRGLVGQESTVRQLALIDLTRDLADVLDVAARFQGFVELLPTAAPELLTADGWRSIVTAQERVNEPTGLPSEPALAEVAEVQRLVGAGPIDPARMIFVAGVAAQTVAGYRVPSTGGVEFSASNRGDGKVLWETIPPALDTYWIDAEHGDLCRTEGAFAGLVELLEQGRTSFLAKEPPVRSRMPTSLTPLPPDQTVIQPDAVELATAALGGSRVTPTHQPPPIGVRVVQENLLFVGAPVLIGHYEGDVFEGGERALDNALGGRLAQRRRLGLYPGALGTAEVVLDERGGRGAVVVGLGEVGELDPRRLRQALAAGLKKYAMTAREAQLERRVSGGLKITSLLVGSGEGGISVRDSIEALLLAVIETLRALEEESAIGDTAMVHFDEIDIIEIWEDKAIQAVDALVSAVATSRFQSAFLANDRIVEGQAGRRRISGPTSDNWPRRLVVTEDSEPRVLRFIAPAERARVEELLVPGNRAVVDRFIERAVERRGFAATGDDPGVTLFELLIPNRLKGIGLGDRGLVLILDDVAARYPWEMMFDRSQGADEPISVRAGMIRQLRAVAAPETQPLAIAPRALVVGDPITRSDFFPQLDGAKAEAEQVCSSLSGRGFEVRSLIRPNAPEQILGALYADPYRIVHLAGHGVFRWLPPGRADGEPDDSAKSAPITGMVLGDGLFLTPELISQMPVAPELVFLNCCYLGEYAPEAEEAARQHLPQLAANLATQFIRLGSRAVIAAGWPVDDAAAELFANRFYGEILDGGRFDRAVMIARRAAFDGHRNVNTWGAYQCYGDASYRLRSSERDGAAGRPVSEPAKTAELPRSREQLRLELMNIVQDAQIDPNAEEAALANRVDHALVQLCARGWECDAQLATAAGQALAELGRLQPAIEMFERAVTANRAETAIRTLEQLVNLQVRLAAARARADGTAAGRTRSAQDMTQALQRLDSLIAAAGASEERLSLKAACYKRLALILGGTERRDALVAMAEHYARATQEDSGGRGARLAPVRPYPLLNWLSGQMLLSLGWQIRKPDRFLARVEAARDAARLEHERQPSFWSQVAAADAELLAAMADGRLAKRGGAEQVEAALTAMFLDAAARASPLKFQSVREHLEFLIEILSGTAVPEAHAIAESLRRLVTRLQLQTGQVR